MSTFGNKGEREQRNPNKPKFAALDINSLYRSTRGETFEPATQKNAAPRKHGMQSLGKVPSARRPPANLPSLKAETSSPSIPPSQVSNEQQQQQTNANSASWADSNQSGTQNSSINAVSSNNNNPALSNINHKNNNNTNSQVQGNQLQQQQQHHQGALSNNNNTNNSNNSNNNNNNNSSSTWSAVATGNVKEDSASQPPLYQSPQFQNEFPSLDGTLMATTSSGSIQNVNAQQQQKLQNQNSFDSGGGNLNLRPSTDAASWMQQQQQLNSANSGNARGAGGENGQQNFQTPEIDGPPKVMALMPSFLRGGNTGIANINTAHSNNSSSSGPSSQPNYQHHKSNMNNNHNSMGNRSGRQNNNNNNNNSNKYDNSSHYNEYSNGLPPPRHRQQPPRHYSGRQNNNNNSNNNSNNDDRSSFEPEVIVQRPIIKEEELERIDSLARDDAWSKHDEVDYNKKLQFSDDETDDMKIKDDRKIDVWRDSEKREMKQQQNGPRSIDPSYIEKMKMVREEEERLERERKVAAQRKLQELEEKSKQQKMQISLDSKPTHEKEIEEKPISGINYTINDSDKKSDHQQQNQQQQQQRDYGKSSKYINDNKFDMYDSQYGRNASAGGADYIKKTTFQSNLPPRFQKQQQYGDRPDERREKGPQNNYKPLHQQDSKNIPFIQHPQSSYDQQQNQQQQQQRWMQYNKGNQQGNPPRRNMSSLSQSSSDDNRQNNSKQPYNTRRRQESEEDDYGRFIKESASSGSLKKSQTVPSAQISRSMSDSSDKLSDHNRSEKSTSREFLTGSNVCWAEVCENDKRLSLDAKEKRRVSESSAISDDQPRTILQRNKPLQEQLSMKENVVKKEISKETKDEEQKTVLSEPSPPKELIELEKKEKVVVTETVSIEQQQQQQGIQSKKSLDIIPEKEQNTMSEKIQQLDNSVNKDTIKSKEMPPKDLDDSRHSSGSNKRSPHSNRYEPSMRGRGNSSYGGYRGNWQRRGGSGHSRSGRYDYSDSENSEEYDQDSWNRKPNRKDINRRDNYGTGGLQKEGFSPRGEPSRRGRGGGSSMTTSQSNFRRTGSNVSNSSAPVKRIDNYGPPSSKSPFSTSDEKTGTSDKKDVVKEKEKLSDDDRMKQKQKALSDGLINKNMKDNSNIVMQQKSSSPTSKSNEESSLNKQHSNDVQHPITQSASNSSITQQQDIKKEIVVDDKNSNDGKNRVTNTSVSQQSYNSRQQQPKYDTGKSAAPVNKSTINKPSMSSTQQSSTGKLPVSSVSTSSTVTSTVSMTSQTSTTSQYNNSGMNNSKQIDSRNSSQTSKYDNSNYRDSRTNDPRNNGSNRMAPRFAKQQRDPTSSNQRVSGNYWDKNNSEGLNDESNKVSLMQQLNSSNSSGSLTNQQISSSTNNSSALKTDMIKQQQQQQQQVGQQSQQNTQNQSMTNTSSTGNQPMLDGASLPKQTLIFENTSYKSAPPSLKRPPQLGGQPNAMNQHPQKDSTPTINEMIEQQAKDHSLTSALQNLSFGQKSDMVDMNSFKFSFDTQLTDDGNTGGFGPVSSSSTHTSQAAVSKASSLGLVGAKTGMQNSNILNTDALNMKVASCKKVWEEPSVEHNTTNADDVMANFVAQQQLQHYAHNNMNPHHTGLSPQSFSYAATSSANDHASSLEHFNKANDNDDSNSYQSQHMSAHVMHSQNQQASMNMKAAEAAFATQNANVCKVKPTQMHQSGLSPPPQMQQNPLQQHQQQFYQTPSYANMPTIPSPPVVYNSAQAAGGLYNPYNMDAARAQMYSYPQSATNNSLSFNAFMQTPNIASAPTHEMYQNLSQYRATVQPYNQTPQLNNPNAAAVLISSATPSNSMMSSKSNTPQQIGAIGSKSSAPQNAQTAATAGQYNQQQYMNHLYHQNSYYPSSTAQQANPYYNATGTAATGNYGMFSGTTNPPQQQMNYGSVGQFPLNSQMLNNLVINQQYRSGPVVAGSSNSGSANSGSNSNTSGYMKQQQQHQSQLQDPASIMKFSSMNEPHSKSYNNWDISPSLSYNSNSYNRGHNNSNNNNNNQNYNSSQHQQSQRMPKVVNNNQFFPNLTNNSQGKSQLGSK